MSPEFDNTTGRREDAEQLAKRLRSLPLERCEYKVDPITLESGWYAPEGLAFRMMGRFVVDTNHSKGVYMVFVPMASQDLFDSDPEGWSYDGAVAIETPTEFVGKWLDVHIGKKKSSLYVRQDIDAYYEDAANLVEFNGFLLPLDGVSWASSVEWVQDYASGEPESCEIDLIPVEEMRSELFIPEPGQNHGQIVLPLGVEVTNDEG